MILQHPWDTKRLWFRNRIEINKYTLVTSLCSIAIISILSLTIFFLNQKCQMALNFESIHYVVQHGQQKVKGKSVHKPFGPPLDGVQIHRKVSPYISSDFPDNLPGPIYTPGWRKRELRPRTSHIHLTRSWTQTSTQNSVHWQVEHCVFSLGVATPSPKVAQGLPCLHFTFVTGRVLLLVGYCIFHTRPTRLFYTHLIPFVMLYLPCHLEEQHHPTCHLHISLLV